MSFPNLFNSLNLANHGTPVPNQAADPNQTHQFTPAIDGSVIDFDDAYGNTSQEPIVIDSTPATPLVGNPLDAIDIDSTASDETTRDRVRSQRPPPEHLTAHYQSTFSSYLFIFLLINPGPATQRAAPGLFFVAVLRNTQKKPAT